MSTLRPSLAQPQGTVRFVLALTIAFALFACSDDKPIAGEITLNSMFDADFDLIDHDGKIATDERFEGKPMLIYFGFTSCPDICPAALGKMTATLDRLGAKADQVKVIFITVDPERDTPERLKQHLAYDGRILGLTGNAAASKAARDALKVYAARREMPDSAMGYTMDHQRLFFITSADGVPQSAIPDSAPTEDIAYLLKKQL